MTLNWQWATAFVCFTVISDSGAAWHEWPQLHPHLFKSRCPDFLTAEMNVPLQEEVLCLSPIHPVGEASSGAVKEEASPPCVFMGSQRWFTVLACSRASYPLLSLCLSRPTFHTPPPLPPLVRERFLSQWVTNESTDIDVLCGWMVPPVPNCRYCNYEAHPASFRDYGKRQLPHIVLIFTEICLLWIVCNMKFGCSSCLSISKILFYRWNHHTPMHRFNLLHMPWSLDYYSLVIRCKMQAKLHNIKFTGRIGNSW